MANKIVYRTEDEVRDSAKTLLGFDKVEANVKQGTGQITTFNQLGFKGVFDKPDGWYLPDDCSIPAIILETKSEAEDISLQKWADELIKNCNNVLDAACGSGAFLVKSMCNMMKEAGGINTKKASKIKDSQLFGIEFDREIFALACANMLIHKDGKTNLEHLDSRSQEACDWIRSKNITKVLMNPPFESKYGCLTIVENVLKNVPRNTKCAFILPDKKLEKDKKGRKLLKHSTLEKIIKLPEKVFSEGVTTSIFIFTAGIPQNDKEIFACYIEDDGLETVKNQGRQDIKDRWQSIEDKWVNVIRKQSGDDTVQWIKPSEHLSYQMPEKPFEIFEEDFTKTMMDYLMFKQGIDVKEFSDSLVKKVMYDSEISLKENDVTIVFKGKGVHNGTD